MIVSGLDKNFLDPLYFTPLYKDFQVRQSKLKYMFFAQMVFIDFYFQNIFYFFKCLVIFPQIKF